MKLKKTAYRERTDESLMLALQQGDKAAFDEIYSRYANPLLGYFMRMLWRDREKAEDFVHDLFAKLIKNPGYFDATRTFKTWVYSVANNMCKNEYKRQEVRKNTTNGVENHFAVSDSSANVMEEVSDNLFRASFEECLDELDQKHREAFVLRHVDGLSIKEIAEITGANEGTIKSRIFYAIKQLAVKLEAFNPEINRI